MNRLNYLEKKLPKGFDAYDKYGLMCVIHCYVQ